jgi:trehalose/maltose hydrolase-like predicted phosphorylase
VLARSDRRGSWSLFTEAIESDVADIQGGTTSEGIHLGAMAGTVDLIQRCYTGIEVRGGRLWLNPCLPDELTGLRIRLRFRGRSLALSVDQRRIELHVISAPADGIRLKVAGEPVRLGAGERYDLPLEHTPCCIDAG